MVSSADSTQIALTAKGLVTSVLPLVMTFIHAPNLSTLPNDIYTAIVAFFSLVSGVMVLFGAIRKIALTFVPEPPKQ